MEPLSREAFTKLLKEQRVKQRLARELRFSPDEITHWPERDMLAISTRSNREGLLLMQFDDFYMVPYELMTGLADKATGRAKPITCDFCLTWQQGGKAGRISFRRDSDGHTFTYLCCGDLLCSLHIRNITSESTLSRTQLREDITVEDRIARFHERTMRILTTLGVEPL